MNRFCTLLGLFSQSRKIQARVIYSYSAVIKAVQRRYHERYHGIMNVTMMQLPDKLTYIDTRSKEYSIQSERKKKIEGKVPLQSGEQ